MPRVKTTIFKRINDKKIALWHFTGDVIALVLCHVIFLSKYQLPYKDIFSPLLPVQLHSISVPISTSLIIVIWLLAFYISGHYSNPARKSGMQVIGPTAVTCFTMSILLFFILHNFSLQELKIQSLELSIRYFLMIFFATFFSRMVIISRLHYLLKTGRRGYKKILIGTNKHALEIIQENQGGLNKNYIGYLNENVKTDHKLSNYLPCLGSINDIQSLVTKEDVDEAIVCLKNPDHNTINHIITDLRQKEILIRLSIENNTIIEGTIKTQSLESFPFITISTFKMPVWQSVFKRNLDVIVALFGLLISTPLCIAIIIAIKRSTDGPIFYKQERIGRHKKPFMIYKFRSMYVDAEKNGPALSSSDDPRITKLGKFMRKWRLDEIPQLINVILGDMSLVGPRPERKYFIDQILPQAPHYAHLFSVRPGITSWGMVKFGYAEDVRQMIDRLQYDILYLENRTLVADLKILLFTLKTIFNGEGK